MTTSLVITVNTDRAELNDYVKQSADSRGEMTALSTLFTRLGSRNIDGKVAVQKSTAAAVSASGTITLTYAKLAANDTVTIGGITLTCVTGTPSGYTQFKKETDATVTATNLKNAINNLATLKIYVSATSALGVVTATAHQAGIVGNLISLTKNSADPDGIAVSAAALAGGTGGASTAAVVYACGLA